MFLAKGKILHEEPVLKIAKETGKSPAQVLIRWSMQNEVLTIPKSTKKNHVLENYESLNFQLPDEAMKILDDLHNDFRVVPINDMQHKLAANMKDGYKLNRAYVDLPGQYSKGACLSECHRKRKSVGYKMSACEYVTDRTCKIHTLPASRGNSDETSTCCIYDTGKIYQNYLVISV